MPFGRDRSSSPSPTGERWLRPHVVLATGGRSLPKTGSDGAGYGLAQSLGHTLVETTPGLAPLMLEGERHAGLAGRSHPATLTLRVHGRTLTSQTGIAAVDALRHQRSGGAESVAPLASRDAGPGCAG